MAAVPLSPRLRLPAIAAGLFLAALAGVLLARHLQLGLALIFAIAYAPLVLFNLPAAMGVWAGLVFVQNLPAAGPATTVAGCALILGWVGETAARRRAGAELTTRHRLVLASTVAFVAWLTASFAWAQSPGVGLTVASKWWIALGILVLYGSTLRSLKAIGWVVGGFVLGAVASVSVGIVQGGLHSVPASQIQQTEEGRLTGGAGDPNYLAAALVPAIVLALTSFGLVRDPLRRLGLLVAIGICAVGLAATESRGGFLAAIVAVALALVLARGRRVQLTAGLLVIASCMGLWLAANPSALERLTSSGDAGTGRTELWRVAIRMNADHPIIGVGVNNFTEHSREYAKSVGSLQFGDLLTERPTLVHNVFLQTLAENGIVGLLLLVLAYGTLLLTTLGAMRRSLARGLRRTELLARGTLVAQIGALTAQFFLSDGYDRRLWILLALGPALMFVASREEPGHG